MKKFNSIFKVTKPIIGMIHIKALPGTPHYKHSINYILDQALIEVEIYKSAGIDSLIIENMHDIPYLKNDVGHEISTMMSIIGYEIKKAFKKTCGIQILAAANKAALAVAKSANLDYIRAEGFVFGHLADEGYIDANAGELLRYRKAIDAENIAIFTDIKKKHSSHAITADISIADTAKAAAFFLSDGLIVTGTGTGIAADKEEVKATKKACNLPVIVGSGITIHNVAQYLPLCDGLIVGSEFKHSGYWANDLDRDRILRFMERVHKL